MWSPRLYDRLHIYPLCGVFYFPWHRHEIEGTNGFYCLIRKTERFTISNVESQVFTPNNSRLPRGLKAGGPRPKRVSYHWTTAPLCQPTMQNCFLMPSRLKIHIILVVNRLQCVARVNCLVFIIYRPHIIKITLLN